MRPYTADQVIHLEHIRAAVAAYCAGLDQLDGDRMKQAYWPDAIDERYGDTAWRFVDHTLSVHEPFSWTMHCLHNHVVEFDADGVTARGEVYVTAYLRSEDPAVLTTFFGRYLDRYEARDGAWRIARRACVHEGSQAVAASPAPWSFAQLRPGAQLRPSRGHPIGP